MTLSHMLQHAAVLVLSVGSFYLASNIQWPIQLRTRNLKDNAVTNGTHNWSPTVLLISLDGLKPAYIDGLNMPTLKALSTGSDIASVNFGTHNVLTAISMVPVSPSLTFPNHWTLQTGLLPSSHGIVANDFHLRSSDDTLNNSFFYTDPTRSWDPSWWHGISIWEKLESLGIKTANLMWPGPPLTRNNIQSTYFQKYEKAWTLEDRVDKVMSWLDMADADRPQFICAYAPDVDSVTHSLGPNEDIEIVAATLRNVDRSVLHLLQGIASRNASSFIDVIIVSDHGMTSTSNGRLVYLDELLGQTLYSHVQHLDGWPNIGLHFGDIRSLEEATLLLKDAAKSSNQQFKVVTKDELIASWRWENTRLVEDRVADLWILPELGWSITTHKEMEIFQQDYRPKGNHGYHAMKHKEMHAFFMSFGPSFRTSDGIKIESFANLEIHNLVMNLLNVPEPDRAPNNGTLGFWDQYLVNR